MPFWFKKTILFLSAFVSQVMLVGGDGVLVLCLGEDGHVAVETGHFNCPYGPLNKHGHPENIDIAANPQSSDVSQKTRCLDLPISIDEEQRGFSSSDFTFAPLHCALSEVRPIESPGAIQPNHGTTLHAREAELLRILQTVILLI